MAARFSTPIVRVFDCHVARPGKDGSLEWLLLRRASTKIYAGDWRMVGGKLQELESAWQACLRELREELQLQPARLLTVPFVNQFYEWQHDRINAIPVFVALTAPTFEPVLDEEHTHYLWLTEGEALSKLPWPGQRDGLSSASLLLAQDTALHAHLEIQLS